jgi:hypothetical protein
MPGLEEQGFKTQSPASGATLRQLVVEEVANAVNTTGIVSSVALQRVVRDEVILRLSEGIADPADMVDVVEMCLKAKRESHDARDKHNRLAEEFVQVRDSVGLMVERMEAVEGRLSFLHRGYDSHLADLDVKAEEARTDLRRDYIQFTDSIKSLNPNYDIDGSFHQEIRVLKRAHTDNQEDYDRRWNKLMEEIRERDAEIQTLHEKLQSAVMDGFKAVDKQFRDVLTSNVTAVRKELKAEIEGLKQGGSGGSGDSGEMDRRFQEAMTEHANSLQNRMEATQDHSDKKHKELQVSIERRHRENQMANSARDAVLEEQIQEEQKERQSLGKECGVKLHAVTYGLFDVIEEVELTGTAAEAKEKRARLHRDLCARLSGAAAAADGPAATEGRSPTSATAARSSAKDGKAISSQDPTKLPPLTPRR